MYSATVTQLNSREYLEIDNFDTIDEESCLMCDGYHGDNSNCMRDE